MKIWSFCPLVLQWEPSKWKCNNIFYPLFTYCTHSRESLVNYNLHFPTPNTDTHLINLTDILLSFKCQNLEISILFVKLDKLGLKKGTKAVFPEWFRKRESVSVAFSPTSAISSWPPGTADLAFQRRVRTKGSSSLQWEWPHSTRKTWLHHGDNLFP